MTRLLISDLSRGVYLSKFFFLTHVVDDEPPAVAVVDCSLLLERDLVRRYDHTLAQVPDFTRYRDRSLRLAPFDVVVREAVLDHPLVANEDPLLAQSHD